MASVCSLWGTSGGNMTKTLEERMEDECKTYTHVCPVCKSAISGMELVQVLHALRIIRRKGFK